MKRLPVLTRENLPAVIESILFVAEEPAEVGALARALHRPKSEVEDALAELDQRCIDGGGTRLQRTGDLVQLVTAPDCGPYVERYLGLEARQLSGAALEALAIIAYKQPVTRAGVEAVRGVNSDGAIASLVGRGLVEEVGHAAGPGRPQLLGTTLKFLEHFGLRNPKDLPPMPMLDAVESDDDELAEGLDLDFDEGIEDLTDDELEDEDEDEEADEEEAVAAEEPVEGA
jgi:segregation and condensation protein B